jgi:cystine transport system substrate-binding protein
VANAIAKKLSVKAEFVATEWAGIIAGPLDRYDAIVAQTARGAKAGRLLEPYTIYGPMLIVHKDNATIVLQDLNGKTIGVTQDQFEKRANGWKQEGINVTVGLPGHERVPERPAAKRIDRHDRRRGAGHRHPGEGLPLKQVSSYIEQEMQAIAVKRGTPAWPTSIRAWEMKATDAARAVA